MNKKDETLKLAAIAFRTMKQGFQMKPEDIEKFEWLCWLALPMKYRLSRDEREKLDRFHVSST